MTICEPHSGGEILCIRLSGLGDVVHGMNALSLLHKYRPNANITWVVEERFADLLQGHPYIDELLTIPRKKWSRSLKNPFRWGQVAPEIADLVLELRRHEYDVSLDFQSSLKSAWLVSAAGANLRVGFAPPVSRELNYLSQNELVRVPDEGCHRIERNLALLGALGIPGQYAEPVFPCEKKYTKPVEWVTKELPRPLVLMHPGTSEFASYKRWAPEHYGHVAERLMDEKGAGVLVTFGPGEEALAHRLVAASSHRAVLAPRLAHLQQLTFLLSEADLFLGSDTGPMHLASGLGVPVVALFGPKDVQGTGPYCSRSRVVTSDVSCRPCDKRKCDDPVCMTGIAEDDVVAACKDLLGSGGVVRGVEGTSVRGPFPVQFELGRYDGEICTSYSRPDFYRFLSSAADEYKPGHHKQTYEGEGCKEKELLFTVEERRCAMTESLGEGSLKNAWRRMVEMSWDNLPVFYPVCYMRDKARELLVVEHCNDETDVREVKSCPGEDEVMREVAKELHRMHAAGYYHRDLARPGSIQFSSDGSLIIDHLERAWNAMLPLFVHEAMVGLDLAAFCKRMTEGDDANMAHELMHHYRNLCDGYRVQKRVISAFAGTDPEDN